MFPTLGFASFFRQITSQHVLRNCHTYMTLRLRIFGKLYLSMEDITNLKIGSIIDYIDNSNLFNRDDLFG